MTWEEFAATLLLVLGLWGVAELVREGPNE